MKIFGVRYNGTELLEHCKFKLGEDIPEWEKEIYSFLLEWNNSDDYIEVVTSGSTGPPKTIKLKKEHVRESALATINFFNLKENNIIWLCLPMKYIASKLVVIRAIVGNLDLIFSDPVSKPSTYYKGIEFTSMVPFQITVLLDSEEGINTLKNIKNILVGGSSISDQLEKSLIKNKINAWHSYGMTETITHIGLRKLGTDKSFIPLPGVKIKLSENDQLIIDYPERGIHNMITNDIAEINQDLSFSIIGRSDNVIISGGVKVQPEKIERLLEDQIKDNFFVTGISDEKLGQKVILVVEGPNKSIDLESVSNYLSDKLLKYEMPREIRYIDKFIFTQSSKVNRTKTLQKRAPA